MSNIRNDRQADIQFLTAKQSKRKHSNENLPLVLRYAEADQYFYLRAKRGSVAVPEGLRAFQHQRASCEEQLARKEITKGFEGVEQETRFIMASGRGKERRICGFWVPNCLDFVLSLVLRRTVMIGTTVLC